MGGCLFPVSSKDGVASGGGGEPGEVACGEVRAIAPDGSVEATPHGLVRVAAAQGPIELRLATEGWTVPGITARTALGDGALWTFTPSSPLAPGAYDLHVFSGDHCVSEAFVVAPLAEPAAWDALDGTRWWVPGSALADPHAALLVRLLSLGGEARALSLELGREGDEARLTLGRVARVPDLPADAAYPPATLALTPADARWTGPLDGFDVGRAGAPLPLVDAVVELSATLDGPADVRIAGTLDLGGLDDEALAEVCALAEVWLAPCVPCPDGAAWCVSLDARGLWAAPR